jgi:DNA-binding beta-propeller fold protein YncE
MKTNHLRPLHLYFMLWPILVATSLGSTGYHIIKKIPLGGGEETWDFATVDESARRLYLTHETEVKVLSADTGKPIATITDLKGAHGVALAPEFKRGFISNGLNATVTMFDLATFKKISDLQAGNLPDAIVYDPATKRVFSFNTVSRNSTVINAAAGKVEGAIDLDGKPEFIVADGKGRIFVDLVDKSTLAVIDSRNLTIEHRWPVTGCDRPTSMAMDRKNQRLFVGCRNLLLFVMDSRDGRLVASAPIGDNVDTTAFDPATGLIFSSTEDGIVTVIHEESPDSFKVVDSIKTQRGSQTMALDQKTHRLFVPYGEVEKIPPSTPGGKVKKRLVANTFGLLIIGR